MCCVDVEASGAGLQADLPTRGDLVQLMVVTDTLNVDSPRVLKRILGEGGVICELQLKELILVPLGLLVMPRRRRRWPWL